jgi:hypothetical protein
LLNIEAPPPVAYYYLTDGISGRFPPIVSGIIYGRVGAAFMPDVGRPKPKFPRARRPVPGGFGSGFGSKGGFIEVVGGYVLAALGFEVSSI